jgi:hypothetical protein
MLLMFLFSDSLIIPIICISTIILIGIFSYYFSSKQKVIRILSKLPMQRIGSLKTNEFSKITGKALHIKKPLIAPFSKRKCIFYCIKIEQKKKSGKHSTWRTLIKEEKVQEFFIEKGGDYVVVKPSQNPKNYLSYLVIDSKTSSGTFNDASLKFEKLLEHYNIKSTGFLGLNKQLRYAEAIIEIGEEITVAGIVKWKTLHEKIEGFNYSKIAELESSAQQKIIITDLPNIKSQRRI